jgi:hypothetical protein
MHEGNMHAARMLHRYHTYWEYFLLKAGITRRQPGDEGSYTEVGPDEK